MALAIVWLVVNGARNIKSPDRRVRRREGIWWLILIASAFVVWPVAFSSDVEALLGLDSANMEALSQAEMWIVMMWLLGAALLHLLIAKIVTSLICAVID
jgi:hypothetical protein